MGLFLFACLALVHSRVIEDHVADAVFKPLVVGGERAGQGRLSFMVSLSLPPAKDKRYHFCGGALIDPTHVLTAAHCLDGSPFEVRIGSTDLGLKEPNSDIIRVKKTFVHPEFDLLTMANDIAILELERAASAQPVMLSGWVALNPEDRGIVAGWGAVNSEATSFPNSMYDASVPIAPLDQCFRLYGHTLVDTTKICVSVSEGTDTCTGDSGGPLFKVHPSFPDRFVQLGVVSWGSEPCGKTPAVYIRVAYYSEWISSIVTSLGKPINWFDATNPATFDLLGPSPTPIPQSSAPTPLKVTPFPTRASIPSTSFSSPTPASSGDASTPTTASANMDDCTCTQEADKWGSTCGVHNDDPLGAWCWVGDNCPAAVLTWWGAKFVYCVAPDDVSVQAPTPFSTSSIAEILLAQNWSFGIPDTWKVVDGSTYMGPSVWQTNKSVVRQSSNVMNLEPRADLPKLGTYMVYTPGVNQWTDYEMSVNLASTDNDILGVMFRYTDDSNYYRFSMDRQSPTMSRRLVRCQNGAFTLLAHDDVPYAIGVFYLLTVIVQQSNIQVLINGQRVFNVLDATFPSGSVALYSWANQDSIFDSVVVSRPGSVATRRLVQPIYGRAVSSQTQAQDALDHPERTNEEGDHDFETNSSSPQALTIGLVVALLVALGAAVAVYLWKKKKCGSTSSKDIELEVEQGDMERINVVTVRSPLHAAPSAALDLDAQDTCDSPSSCTGLKAPLSPPPLPAWPEGDNNNNSNSNNKSAIPDRNLRTPTSRTRKHPRTVSLPQPPATYQPPVTYSLKKLPSSQRALAAQNAPMSMPRSSRPPSQFLQQEPAPPANFGEGTPAHRLTASSSKQRYPELRQRPPKSPEQMHSSPSTEMHTSPEILVPSPMSVTPEPPMFPANDYCLPSFDTLSPPRNQANNQQWIEVSPSRTPSPHRELELSPPPAAAPARGAQSRAQPQQQQQARVPPQYQQPQQQQHHANKKQPPRSHPPPASFQHEAWEEIRFDDESDCSDGGVEYFHDR